MNKTSNLSPPLPIAVIGMGALFPKSQGLKDYWRLIYHGIDAITEVPPTHWQAADYFDPDPQKADHVYCKRGGFLDPFPFDPTEFGIPPAILEATDSSQLLGLIAAKMALEDAGYGPEQHFNRERTSVILGVTGTQELVIPLSTRLGHPIWRRALTDAGVSPRKQSAVMKRISGSYVPWQENSFPGLLGNVVAGRIANRLDLGGTNCVVDAACASSLGALHLALMELLSGHSDMVVTGGVDTLNDIFMHMCFSKSLVLSPTGDARPFSEAADGTVLGEGIGILVLKRLPDAEKAGDRVYALIKGVGSGSDGKSQSIYAPRVEGQVKAVESAYQNAAVSPDTVELIEAHGTGTRVGDKTEFQALTSVFGKSVTSPCALGSVKSMIGHTKAAAGSAGLIKTVLALHHKVLPPTTKVDKPDPELQIDKSRFYLNAEARPWFSDPDHPRRAGVSAFGFGGSNFHVVLEEYTPAKSEPAWEGSVEIFAFSGACVDNLKDQIQALLKRLDENLLDWETARYAAESRSAFSTSAPCRLLLISDCLVNPGASELRQLLAEALKRLETEPARTHWQAGNIFFGTGARPGKTAFLFPGQGSQYLHMGRDLASIFPEAHAVMEQANRTFKGSPRLSDYIYPLPKQLPGKNPKPKAALRDTAVAQPAIGAVSLAALRVLERFSLKADAVGGHSFGELSALCAAGRLDLQTFLALAATRGRCMADAGNDVEGADPGTMLAVRAPVERLQEVCRQTGPAIVLANRNSPDQGVLSGPTATVLKAEEICKQSGFMTIRLPVSAAFHTSLINNAQAPFETALDPVHIRPGTIPVLSNTSGQFYADDPVAAKSLLCGQMLHPVEFMKGIEHLYEAGIRTFIEVGPKTVLTGLVRAILKGKEHTALSLDRSSGKGSGLLDLARILCHMGALGYEVDLSQWESPAPKERTLRMQIPICGANYRNPLQKRIPESHDSKKKITERKPDRPDPAPAKRDTMDKKQHSLQEALQVVQQGLKSIQALQQETATAHQKFLETQAEAGRTLRLMMEKTQHLAEAAFGIRPLPSASSNTAINRVPEIEIPQKEALSNDFKIPESPAPPVVDSTPVQKPEPAPLVATKPPAKIPEPPSNGLNKITAKLLEVVAQLTGYPVEMLGTDMDIESDLGIDSIKRVEILSTLEETLPGLPTVPPEQMGRLKTLGQIATYLADAAPEKTQATLPESEPQTLVAEKESAPIEAPLTIPRSIVTLETDPARPFTDSPLPLQGTVVIIDSGSDLSTPLKEAFAEKGLKAEIRTPKDFIKTQDLADMVGLVIPYGTSHPNRLSEAFETARQAAPALIRAARQEGAFFATITCMDGGFGFTGAGFNDPLEGGLAGLVKTAAREWNGVLCRAFDVAPELKGDPETVQVLVSEMLNPDPAGPVEIGFGPRLQKNRILLKPAPFPEGPLNMDDSDVWIVSAGARGVTAAAVLALAQTAPVKLVLLGRSPAPTPEPAWLSSLQNEHAVKHALIENEFKDKTVSPKEIESAFQRCKANREIATTLETLRNLGIKVNYYPVDIRQPEAVRDVFDRVRADMGPICGILHGAGVLADRFIMDKTSEQFKAVFDTKVLGLQNLLSAAQADPLKYLILFSSVTARIGNPGQVDYAMANEVLNKTAQLEALARPGCRVISVNWGPWAGGMVSDSLKREFERQGVALIPLSEGGKALVQEMRGGPGSPVEVVIGAALVQEPALETASPPLSLTCRRELALETHPVLKAHMLDRQAVVPFALMSEWLGHSALHENPGLVLQGFDNIRLFKGIRLDQEQKTVRLMAGKIEKKGANFEVAVEIHDGFKEGQAVVHYGAKAILADRFDAPPAFIKPAHFNTNGYPRSINEIYAKILFHGTELQGLREIIHLSDKGMVARIRSAAPPLKWMSNPLRSRWISDPLVLDSAFQMATLWCYEQSGAPSLPSFAARYRQYRSAFPADGVLAVLEISEVSGHKMKGDFTFLDSDDKMVAQMIGYEAVMDPALIKAFKPEPEIRSV